MADLTRLQSATDAAESRYAPLSWLAVASLAVGGVFVLALVLLGAMAFWGGKTLYLPLLLAVPLLGILLAFAARRSIRNSEGARTGTEYANVGWWLCVVSGLCFAAYLLAVDWAVRTDAQKQMKGWVDQLMAGDPTNPDDPAVKAAYIKMVDVANQDSQQVKDANLFRVEHGNKLLALRQSNLLLIAARNRDTASVEPRGLVTWEQQEGELVCEAAGLLHCAEGDFPVSVRMRATTADGKRRWQVLPSEQFIPEGEGHKPIGGRTRYGWMVDRLNDVAVDATTEVALTLMGHQPRQPLFAAGYQYVPPSALGQGVTIDTFVSGKLPRGTAERILLSAFGRQMVLGGGGALWGETITPPDSFFAREDGKPLSADDLKLLRSCFDPRVPIPERIVPPGRRNPMMVLRNSVISIGDDRVTVKTAVEMKPDSQEFQANAQLYTVGRLVFVCDDPQVVKEFREAKQARGALSGTPPPDVATRSYPLRLVGLESNLPRLTPPAQQQRQQMQ